MEPGGPGFQRRLAHFAGVARPIIQHQVDLSSRLGVSDVQRLQVYEEAGRGLFRTQDLHAPPPEAIRIRSLAELPEVLP